MAPEKLGIFPGQGVSLEVGNTDHWLCIGSDFKKPTFSLTERWSLITEKHPINEKCNTHSFIRDGNVENALG